MIFFDRILEVSRKKQCACSLCAAFPPCPRALIRGAGIFKNPGRPSVGYAEGTMTAEDHLIVEEHRNSGIAAFLAAAYPEYVVQPLEEAMAVIDTVNDGPSLQEMEELNLGPQPSPLPSPETPFKFTSSVFRPLPETWTNSSERTDYLGDQSSPLVASPASSVISTVSSVDLIPVGDEIAREPGSSFRELGSSHRRSISPDP